MFALSLQSVTLLSHGGGNCCQSLHCCSPHGQYKQSTFSLSLQSVSVTLLSHRGGNCCQSLHCCYPHGQHDNISNLRLPLSLQSVTLLSHRSWNCCQSPHCCSLHGQPDIEHKQYMLLYCHTKVGIAVSHLKLKSSHL